MGIPQDIQRWERIESEPSDSPLGGAERPVVASLQYYMPELFPIPGAQEFEVFDIVASPGAGTLTPAGLIFTVPQSCIGVVRVITAGVDDMTNATRLSFQMRLDGGRVLGAAGNFQPFPGVAARATVSADVWVWWWVTNFGISRARIRSFVLRISPSLLSLATSIIRCKNLWIKDAHLRALKTWTASRACWNFRKCSAKWAKGHYVRRMSYCKLHDRRSRAKNRRKWSGHIKSPCQDWQGLFSSKSNFF